MIKAIVYLTNTGSTRRYAEMISDITGLPAFALNEAGGRLRLNDRVFYLGWVLQGRIRGYNRAAVRYHIVGACAVGITPDTDDIAKEIKQKTGITDPRIKVFYARGIFDMEKLNPIHRLLMSGVLKRLKEEGKEQDTIELLESGGDYVSADNIKTAADWITNYNRRFGKG